ncbi:MAG TPA: hypothetical protein VGK17_03680 [Propionicimonas sp.]
MKTFNAPPGWAVPSAGWTPPPGWEPDPGWPPTPEGWNLWIETSEPDLALPDTAALAPSSSGMALDSQSATATARDSEVYEATVARLQDAANWQFLIGSLWALGGLALTRVSPYVLGGNIRVVFWGAMLVGGYQLLRALVAHASAPSEARKLLRTTSDGSPGPGQSRGGTMTTEAQILGADEATRRAQAEREQRDAEQRERFDALDAIPALLADDDLARQARKVKQMYGSAVCASFLKRKAAERGLGDIDVSENDIPDSF